MTRKITISAVVAFCIGFLAAPPDLIAMVINGFIAAFLCAVPLVVLARLSLVKSASKPVHTLICVLVCMVALLSLECYLLSARLTGQAERLPEPSAVSFSLTSEDMPAGELEPGGGRWAVPTLRDWRRQGRPPGCRRVNRIRSLGLLKESIYEASRRA